MQKGRDLILGVGAALVAIDVQRGFDLEPSGPRNNPAMEGNGQRLLACWRALRWPVIHVRHDSVMPFSPLRPGHLGNAFKAGFEPASGEPIIAKSVNSAFIGTGFEELLWRQSASKLVVFGISTDMCVSTTVRMAANLGFDVIVAGDACHAWGQSTPDGQFLAADDIHRSHLTTLHSEFATVSTTDAICDAAEVFQKQLRTLGLSADA